MRFNPLGKTGLLVSELCLGTMTFGTTGRFSEIGGLDQAAADRLVARALNHGINIVDTADGYTDGLAEEILGRAIDRAGVARSEVIIATKGYAATGHGPNEIGTSRLHIMEAVKASLRRLGTDHIDLYQLHGHDDLTPLDETVRALEDLVRGGQVRYVGVCNWPAWRLAQALSLAEHRGWNRIASLQAYYTVAGRDLERELVPLLRDQTVGLMVWSPLAGGLLSGKYGRDGNAPDNARRATFDFPPVDRERAFACIDVMRAIAAARNASVAQIALAWLLHRPWVSTVIVGARSLAQLDDNLAASGLTLSDEDLQRLDAVSVLPREYPGWMIERQTGNRRAHIKKAEAAGRKPSGR